MTKEEMMANVKTSKEAGKKASGPPPDYDAAVAKMGPEIDWQKDFGQVGNGQDAADQVYGQAVSRLDPQWARREEAQRTQLMNQGLDPNSEAYKNSMTDLGQQRNDAYGQARSQSVAQSQQMLQSNLMARQQAIAEALRRRTQPLNELGQMQGLYQTNGQIEAANNPLSGFGDILGAGLDVAGMFGLGMPGQGSMAKGLMGGGKGGGSAPSEGFKAFGGKDPLGLF